MARITRGRKVMTIGGGLTTGERCELYRRPPAFSPWPRDLAVGLSGGLGPGQEFSGVFQHVCGHFVIPVQLLYTFRVERAATGLLISRTARLVGTEVERAL